MFTRIALALAIVLHASPAWICVASCRIQAELASINLCIVACTADPVVAGDACAGEASPCAGCCSGSFCETQTRTEPAPESQRPCDSGGCADCGLCICVLAPPDSYLLIASSAKAPAPDSTPILPWFQAPGHPAPVSFRLAPQAPPRPPWTPVRSMLSVWTI